MSDLERVTAAFQSMNPWAQELLRDMAIDYAKSWPAPKPAPHLRLMRSNGTSTPRGRASLVEPRDPAPSPTSLNPVINQIQAVPDELVALFLSMDEEAQIFTLETARVQAKRYPKKRPALCLVAGEAGTGALGTGAGSMG